MTEELKQESPEFRAWVETLPDKHWAKYDLSACRLGWEAGRAALQQESPRAAVKPLEWSGKSIDGSNHYAETVLGRYQAWEIQGRGYFHREPWPCGKEAGRTIDEAKVAAQADYEQRINSALAHPLHQPAPESGEPLTIIYTNWRRETSERLIRPIRLWYGKTDWHHEPQWLLKAIDLEKNAERDFAWAGIDFQGNGPAVPVPEPQAPSYAQGFEAAKVAAAEKAAMWITSGRDMNIGLAIAAAIHGLTPEEPQAVCPECSGTGYQDKGAARLTLSRMPCPRGCLPPEPQAPVPDGVSDDQAMAVLPNGNGVCLSGRFAGWLFRRHPDGQWISVRKLELRDPAEGNLLAALAATKKEG